jgi:response regulator RpfG family c-di-GMP phosphodiesterase
MQKARLCVIIDDDPDDREIFEMCVRKVSDKVKCISFENGVDAIASIKSDSALLPDYIFIDVNMPKLNGVACLEILKKMERLKYSKFFMYSTTSDASSVDNSKSLGASEYIVKPSKTAELKAKLFKIFEIVSEINPDTPN